MADGAQRLEPLTGAGVVVLVALAVLLRWGGGCIEGRGALGAGEPCSASTSCGASLVCLYGRCRPACSFDRDCGPGRVCVDAPGGAAGRVCTFEDEAGCSSVRCPEGLLCSPDGLCRNPCEGASCRDLADCVDGICVERPPAGGDGDADGDADAGLDGGADADAVDADAPAANADVNGDGCVDSGDVDEVFFHRGEPASVCPPCDINGDGAINVTDARLVVGACTNSDCSPCA